MKVELFMNYDVSDILTKGVQKHQAQKLDEAYQYYWSVLAQDLYHPEAMHLAGILAFEQNRFHISKLLFEYCLKIDPSKPTYLHDYGLIMENLDDYTKAFSCYEESLKRDSNFIDAYISYAEALCKKSKYKEAFRLTKKGLKRFPNSPDLLNIIGLIYSKYGKNNDAIAQYQLAIQLNPKNTKVLMNLGNIYQTIGKYEKSIEYYRKLLNLNSTNLFYYEKLGFLFLITGQFKECLSVLKMALNIDPDNEQIAVLLLKLQYLLESDSHLDEIRNYNHLSPLNLGQAEVFQNLCIFSQYSVDELLSLQELDFTSLTTSELSNRILFIQPFLFLSTNNLFHVYRDPFIPQESPASEYQTLILQNILSTFANVYPPNNLVLFTSYSSYLIDLIPIIRSLGYQIAFIYLNNGHNFGKNPKSIKQEKIFIQALDYLYASNQTLADQINLLGGKYCQIINKLTIDVFQTSRH